ncbi:hypothetical protein [Labrys wisconsinensis]|uniref:N-terminal of MaoC-like dehydratase domain-containing protein n=1 Tax=Labrys wisconsinensis TaxID=425677 RepID=A0ABU0IZ13_9HYPH|nr:hypothetical protein [Labrys wisconsinensis]MDQ0467257.1 hypothetical protein [Labrys wisconsinensis]
MTDASERVAHLHIGPIEARIEPHEVAAYARATAIDGEAPEPDRVPATFPAVWLWHPRAQAAVAGVGGEGKAPVLTAQRFSYRQALRIGETYRFEIDRRGDAADPDAFVIEAVVQTLGGEVAAEFAASYRLFARPEP